VFEEVREKVDLDLRDKNDALDIDIRQLDLTENSAGISHKPDATRIPKGSTQPETWYQFSENNKMLAEQVMRESQRLREAIFHSIEQTSNDLRVQQDTTNFDFRKRHYEMKRAKEELEYQMKTTKQEIEEQVNNVKEMELAIQRKENPLKLAETRLENRTNRPHVELCTDAPMEGLSQEVQTLRDTIHKLTVKLDHSRETLTELEAHLHKLEEDHKNKCLALALDTQCVDIRKKLVNHDAGINKGFDRNQKLTGILRQNTRFLENSKHAKY
jgi:tektin-2